MELDTYAGIKWDTKSRKEAVKEFNRERRDRRLTTFLKGLEGLSNLQARVHFIDGVYYWASDYLTGSLSLGGDHEWSVKT